MSGFQIFALCMAFFMANLALYWLYHVSMRVMKIELLLDELFRKNEDL